MSHVPQRFVALTALLAVSAGLPLQAQNAPPASAPIAQEFEKLHFRSIGPATMSGRVADVAVYEANPAVYYVGTAHGGVWKTTSNGAMFTPLFQDQGLIAIGDVAVSQNNPDLRLGGHGRVEQPPEHVVGQRHLQVHRWRQDVRVHGSRATPSTSTASSSIRATTMS